MDETTQSVVSYEERLAKDRQKMLEITRKMEENNLAELKDKMDFFGNELKYLEHQYHMLKLDVDLKEQLVEAKKNQSNFGAQSQMKPSGALPTVQPQMKPFGAQPQPISAGVIPSAGPAEGTEQPITREWVRQQTPASANLQKPVSPAMANPQKPVSPAMANPQKPVSPAMASPQKPIAPATSREPEKKHNIEGAIGKTLMGIMASVLIFISLILFATLLLPFLNDTIKMIACFVVSAVFLGAGFFGLAKDKENKLALSFLGCGVGAIYITLILCNVVFKTIGDVPLYILFLIWTVFICILSRFNNWIFHVIGQLGVTISIAFGVVQCCTSLDSTKFLILVAYSVVAELLFYILHCRKGLAANIISHGFNLVDLLSICIGLIVITFTQSEGRFLWVPFLLFLYCVGFMVRIYLESSDKNGVFYGVLTLFYGSVAFGLLLLSCAYMGVNVITLSIYGLAFLLFVSTIFLKEKVIGRYLVQVQAIIFALAAVISNEFLRENLGMVMLCIPLLTYGYLAGNTMSKYISLGLGLILAFFCPEPWVQMLTGVAFTAATFLLAHFCKKQYSFVSKILSYVLFIIFFAKNIAGMVQYVTIVEPEKEVVNFFILLILSVINTVLMLTPLSRNVNDDREDFRYVTDVVNSILMIYGLVLLFNVDSLYQILTIAITVALFLLNTKRIYQDGEAWYQQIYLGLKYSVLVVTILTALEAAQSILSVAMIILAILCIVFGYIKQHKVLRIYGLVVTMVSVIKLILFDISYSNTLAHAIGFFISGVMCFAISIIYYIIEKKMKANEGSN